MKLIILDFAIILMVTMMPLLLDSCGPTNVGPHHSLIEDVGGCDSYGMCGVRLRDGTVLSDVPQPVRNTFPDCTRPNTCREVIQ